MSTFNRQLAFDTACAALLKQGRQAMSEDGAGCVYRGPGGVKCAVGWLIPDEKYRPAWDAGFGTTPGSPSRKGGEVRTALGIRGPESADAQFLTALQGVHDNADAPDFVEDFRERALRFAETWNLDASVLEQVTA